MVAPSTLRSPWWRRYPGLLWRGLTARGRFDGVEGHFALPSGVVAIVVARIRRLPLVVVAHGSDVGVIAERHPILGWLARRVVRGADLVVANSEHTRSRVERLGAHAIVINPRHRARRVCRAAAAPRSAACSTSAGRTPARDTRSRAASPTRCAAPGLEVAAPGEIPALLAAHDVLLVPSRAEAFGIAAAEAIAAGRWVVAADVGGLREVVTDGVNGTLVGDGDYAGALARVPEYDPVAVAATAARFDVAEQRRAMAEAWNAVLARR